MNAFTKPPESAALKATTAEITAQQVVKFAIAAANDVAIDLFDGLKVLEVMGEADSVELSGDTLKWLCAKFKADANDIMPHLDHAERAREGRVYSSAGEHYRDAVEAEARS